MGTFDVVDKISDLPLLNYVGVVDLFDKLSFIATCVLLIACSLIVTLREYVMDPITCYMSHNPGGENLLKFVEHYCWVQGTMAMDDQNIPDSEDKWKMFEKSRIVYYQWVPFMLLFQAALFHTPKILWTIFTFNMAGDNIQQIVKLSTISNNTKDLANRIDYLLVQHREYRKSKFQSFKRKVYESLPLCLVSKRFSNWLASGYMLTKFLYLINSIGQIYLMQTFLHLNNHHEYSSNFGIEISKNIINGRNWEMTGVFPRVTFCMARIKQLAAVNTITAQCVLTANLFIEKIYIFLWFWVVLVAVSTAFSCIIWLLRFLVPSFFHKEVKKHLRLVGRDDYSDSSIDGFCKEFLRLDGIFMLHMININSGDLVTTPLVDELYSRYKKNYENKRFTKKDLTLTYVKEIPVSKKEDKECLMNAQDKNGPGQQFQDNNGPGQQFQDNNGPGQQFQDNNGPSP